MIVTLPVGEGIDATTLSRVPGVSALEYRSSHATLLPDLPAFLHLGTGIVQDAFLLQLDDCRRLLTRRPFGLFSFDCGPAVSIPQLEDYYYVGSPVLPRSALKELIASRIEMIRRCTATPLAVENLNYFPTDAYKHVCEAKFLSEVVQENDIGLLLDLAHAVVTAHNTNRPVLDYLRALPLDRVRAIHLSSPGVLHGVWRDLHRPPTRCEYDLLDSILAYVPSSAYIAIEDSSSLSSIIAAYGELNGFLQERAIERDGLRCPTTV